jgi:hypothetical protein
MVLTTVLKAKNGGERPPTFFKNVSCQLRFIADSVTDIYEDIKLGLRPCLIPVPIFLKRASVSAASKNQEKSKVKQRASALQDILLVQRFVVGLRTRFNARFEECEIISARIAATGGLPRPASQPLGRGHLARGGNCPVGKMLV